MLGGVWLEHCASVLSRMAKADFVSMTPMDDIRMSLEFLRLAHLTVGISRCSGLALTHMRRLTDACNETSVLGLF